LFFAWLELFCSELNVCYNYDITKLKITNNVAFTLYLNFKQIYNLYFTNYYKSSKAFLLVGSKPLVGLKGGKMHVTFLSQEYI